MNRPFTTIAGVILVVVAIAHVLRIVWAWPILIGTTDIPMWVSWAGVIVAGAVGIMTLREARK